MSRRIEPRVAALERRAERAAFDPRAVCMVAGRCYLDGVPLPVTLSARERSLATEMLRALILTEESRWWSHEPLPMPSPVGRPLS
jgi:hypothetical protein